MKNTDKVKEILNRYSMRHDQLYAEGDDIIIEASDFTEMAQQINALYQGEVIAEILISEAKKDVAYKHLDDKGKIDFESGFISGYFLSPTASDAQLHDQSKVDAKEMKLKISEVLYEDNSITAKVNMVDRMWVLFIQNQFTNPEHGKEFELFLDEMHQWQCETFGEATDLSKLHHLKEEVDELINTVSSRFDDTAVHHEYADAFFLLFGSVYARGNQLSDIIEWMKSKFEINKNRKWGKPDKNGVVNHISPTAPIESEQGVNVDELKRMACDFFRYFWNHGGTNAEQGFDTWWKDYPFKSMKQESEHGKEEICALELNPNECDIYNSIHHKCEQCGHYNSPDQSKDTKNAEEIKPDFGKIDKSLTAVKLGKDKKPPDWEYCKAWIEQLREEKQEWVNAFHNLKSQFAQSNNKEKGE